MAEKRGAGSEAKGSGDAAAKQSAPAKGATSAGGKTPPRTGRASGAGATAETGSTPKKGAASDTATGKSAAGGASRRTASASAAGGSKTAEKGAAKSADKGSAKGGASGKAGGRKNGSDLRKDLRDFAGGRPDGWSHEDWLKFLEDLQSRGHNINDRDAIGSMLERERLALALERIPGVGPQRVKSIADRYGYLWRLRETNADQLSKEANVPRDVAEKVLSGLKR